MGTSEQIILTLVLSLAFCFIPKIRYLAQMLGTVIHELGHAIVVMPFGGKLQGIKLRINAEGEAIVALPQYPSPWYQILRIINLFAGYSAPIYLSAIFFASYYYMWDIGLTIILLLLSITVLFFIRNFFGIIVALGFTGLNLLFIFPFNEWLDLYALGLSVILLVRGIIDIFNIARWTFKSKLPSSDFVLASNELKGSPQLWFILFSIFHSVVITGLITVFFLT